ncbi:MAG: hypothetical protein LBI69_02060 [Puniceicoccales bacterium]|jgi:hypothetical protein|nr:hypothetical protein [Puniceicoccales bacterium]
MVVRSGVGNSMNGASTYSGDFFGSAIMQLENDPEYGAIASGALNATMEQLVKDGLLHDPSTQLVFNAMEYELGRPIADTANTQKFEVYCDTPKAKVKIANIYIRETVITTKNSEGANVEENIKESVIILDRGKLSVENEHLSGVFICKNHDETIAVWNNLATCTSQGEAHGMMKDILDGKIIYKQDKDESDAKFIDLNAKTVSAANNNLAKLVFNKSSKADGASNKLARKWLKVLWLFKMADEISRFIESEKPSNPAVIKKLKGTLERINALSRQIFYKSVNEDSGIDSQQIVENEYRTKIQISMEELEKKLNETYKKLEKCETSVANPLQDTSPEMKSEIAPTCAFSMDGIEAKEFVGKKVSEYDHIVEDIFSCCFNGQEIDGYRGHTFLGRLSTYAKECIGEVDPKSPLYTERLSTFQSMIMAFIERVSNDLNCIDQFAKGYDYRGHRYCPSQKNHSHIKNALEKLRANFTEAEFVIINITMKHMYLDPEYSMITEHEREVLSRKNNLSEKMAALGRHILLRENGYRKGCSQSSMDKFEKTIESLVGDYGIIIEAAKECYAQKKDASELPDIRFPANNPNPPLNDEQKKTILRNLFMSGYINGEELHANLAKSANSRSRNQSHFYQSSSEPEEAVQEAVESTWKAHVDGYYDGISLAKLIQFDENGNCAGSELEKADAAINFFKKCCTIDGANELLTASGCVYDSKRGGVVPSGLKNDAQCCPDAWFAGKFLGALLNIDLPVARDKYQEGRCNANLDKIKGMQKDIDEALKKFDDKSTCKEKIKYIDDVMRKAIFKAYYSANNIISKDGRNSSHLKQRHMDSGFVAIARQNEISLDQENYGCYTDNRPDFFSWYSVYRKFLTTEMGVSESGKLPLDPHRVDEVICKEIHESLENNFRSSWVGRRYNISFDMRNADAKSALYYIEIGIKEGNYNCKNLIKILGDDEMLQYFQFNGAVESDYVVKEYDLLSGKILQTGKKKTPFRKIPLTYSDYFVPADVSQEIADQKANEKMEALAAITFLSENISIFSEKNSEKYDAIMNKLYSVIPVANNVGSESYMDYAMRMFFDDANRMLEKIYGEIIRTAYEYRPGNPDYVALIRLFQLMDVRDCAFAKDENLNHGNENIDDVIKTYFSDELLRCECKLTNEVVCDLENGECNFNNEIDVSNWIYEKIVQIQFGVSSTFLNRKAILDDLMQRFKEKKESTKHHPCGELYDEAMNLHALNCSIQNSQFEFIVPYLCNACSPLEDMPSPVAIKHIPNVNYMDGNRGEKSRQYDGVDQKVVKNRFQLIVDKLAEECYFAKLSVLSTLSSDIPSGIWKNDAQRINDAINSFPLQNVGGYGNKLCNKVIQTANELAMSSMINHGPMATCATKYERLEEGDSTVITGLLSKGSNQQTSSCDAIPGGYCEVGGRIFKGSFPVSFKPKSIKQEKYESLFGSEDRDMKTTINGESTFYCHKFTADVTLSPSNPTEIKLDLRGPCPNIKGVGSYSELRLINVNSETLATYGLQNMPKALLSDNYNIWLGFNKSEKKYAIMISAKGEIDMKYVYVPSGEAGKMSLVMCQKAGYSLHYEADGNKKILLSPQPDFDGKIQKSLLSEAVVGVQFSDQSSNSAQRIVHINFVGKTFEGKPLEFVESRKGGLVLSSNENYELMLDGVDRIKVDSNDNAVRVVKEFPPFNYQNTIILKDGKVNGRYLLLFDGLEVTYYARDLESVQEKYYSASKEGFLALAKLALQSESYGEVMGFLMQAKTAPGANFTNREHALIREMLGVLEAKIAKGLNSYNHRMLLSIQLALDCSELAASYGNEIEMIGNDELVKKIKRLHNYVEKNFELVGSKLDEAEKIAVRKDQLMPKQFKISKKQLQASINQIDGLSEIQFDAEIRWEMNGLKSMGAAMKAVDPARKVSLDFRAANQMSEDVLALESAKGLIEKQQEILGQVISARDGASDIITDNINTNKHIRASQIYNITTVLFKGDPMRTCAGVDMVELTGKLRSTYVDEFGKLHIVKFFRYLKGVSVSVTLEEAYEIYKICINYIKVCGIINYAENALECIVNPPSGWNQLSEQERSEKIPRSLSLYREETSSLYGSQNLYNYPLMIESMLQSATHGRNLTTAQLKSISEDFFSDKSVVLVQTETGSGKSSDGMPYAVFSSFQQNQKPFVVVPPAQAAATGANLEAVKMRFGKGVETIDLPKIFNVYESNDDSERFAFTRDEKQLKMLYDLLQSGRGEKNSVYLITDEMITRLCDSFIAIFSDFNENRDANASRLNLLQKIFEILGNKKSTFIVDEAAQVLDPSFSFIRAIADGQESSISPAIIDLVGNIYEALTIKVNQPAMMSDERYDSLNEFRTVCNLRKDGQISLNSSQIDEAKPLLAEIALERICAASRQVSLEVHNGASCIKISNVRIDSPNDIANGLDAVKGEIFEYDPKTFAIYIRYDKFINYLAVGNLHSGQNFADFPDGDAVLGALLEGLTRLLPTMQEFNNLVGAARVYFSEVINQMFQKKVGTDIGPNPETHVIAVAYKQGKATNAEPSAPIVHAATYWQCVFSRGFTEELWYNTAALLQENYENSSDEEKGDNPDQSPQGEAFNNLYGEIPITNSNGPVRYITFSYYLANPGQCLNDVARYFKKLVVSEKEMVDPTVIQLFNRIAKTVAENQLQVHDRFSEIRMGSISQVFWGGRQILFTATPPSKAALPISIAKGLEKSDIKAISFQDFCKQSDNVNRLHFTKAHNLSIASVIEQAEKAIGPSIDPKSKKHIGMVIDLSGSAVEQAGSMEEFAKQVQSQVYTREKREIVVLYPADSSGNYIMLDANGKKSEKFAGSADAMLEKGIRYDTKNMVVIFNRATATGTNLPMAEDAYGILITHNKKDTSEDIIQAIGRARSKQSMVIVAHDKVGTNALEQSGNGNSEEIKIECIKSADVAQNEKIIKSAVVKVIGEINQVVKMKTLKFICDSSEDKFPLGENELKKYIKNFFASQGISSYEAFIKPINIKNASDIVNGIADKIKSNFKAIMENFIANDENELNFLCKEIMDEISNMAANFSDNVAEELRMLNGDEEIVMQELAASGALGGDVDVARNSDQQKSQDKQQDTEKLTDQIKESEDYRTKIDPISKDLSYDIPYKPGDFREVSDFFLEPNVQGCKFEFNGEENNFKLFEKSRIAKWDECEKEIFESLQLGRYWDKYEDLVKFSDLYVTPDFLYSMHTSDTSKGFVAMLNPNREPPKYALQFFDKNNIPYTVLVSEKEAAKYGELIMNEALTNCRIIVVGDSNSTISSMSILNQPESFELFESGEQILGLYHCIFTGNAQEISQKEAYRKLYADMVTAGIQIENIQSCMLVSAIARATKEDKDSKKAANIASFIKSDFLLTTGFYVDDTIWETLVKKDGSAVKRSDIGVHASLGMLVTSINDSNIKYFAGALIIKIFSDALDYGSDDEKKYAMKLIDGDSQDNITLTKSILLNATESLRIPSTKYTNLLRFLYDPGYKGMNDGNEPLDALNERARMIVGLKRECKAAIFLSLQYDDDTKRKIINNEHFTIDSNDIESMDKSTLGLMAEHMNKDKLDSLNISINVLRKKSFSAKFTQRLQKAENKEWAIEFIEKLMKPDDNPIIQQLESRPIWMQFIKSLGNEILDSLKKKSEEFSNQISELESEQKDTESAQIKEDNYNRVLAIALRSTIHIDWFRKLFNAETDGEIWRRRIIEHIHIARCEKEVKKEFQKIFVQYCSFPIAAKQFVAGEFTYEALMEGYEKTKEKKGSEANPMELIDRSRYFSEKGDMKDLMKKLAMEILVNPNSELPSFSIKQLAFLVEENGTSTRRMMYDFKGNFDGKNGIATIFENMNSANFVQLISEQKWDLIKFALDNLSVKIDAADMFVLMWTVQSILHSKKPPSGDAFNSIVTFMKSGSEMKKIFDGKYGADGSKKAENFSKLLDLADDMFRGDPNSSQDDGKDFSIILLKTMVDINALNIGSDRILSIIRGSGTGIAENVKRFVEVIASKIANNAKFDVGDDDIVKFIYLSRMDKKQDPKFTFDLFKQYREINGSLDLSRNPACELLALIGKDAMIPEGELEDMEKLILSGLSAASTGISSRIVKSIKNPEILSIILRKCKNQNILKMLTYSQLKDIPDEVWKAIPFMEFCNLNKIYGDIVSEERDLLILARFREFYNFSRYNECERCSDDDTANFLSAVESSDHTYKPVGMETYLLSIKQPRSLVIYLWRAIGNSNKMKSISDEQLIEIFSKSDNVETVVGRWLADIMGNIDMEILKELEEKFSGLNSNRGNQALYKMYNLYLDTRENEYSVKHIRMAESFRDKADLFQKITPNFTNGLLTHAVNEKWKKEYDDINLEVANFLLENKFICNEKRDSLIIAQISKYFSSNSGAACQISTYAAAGQSIFPEDERPLDILLADRSPFFEKFNNFKLIRNCKYFWDNITSAQWDALCPNFFVNNPIDSAELGDIKLNLSELWEKNSNSKEKIISMLKGISGNNKKSAQKLFSPILLTEMANGGHLNDSLLERFDDEYLHEISVEKLTITGVNALIGKLSSAQCGKLSDEIIFDKSFKISELKKEQLPTIELLTDVLPIHEEFVKRKVGVVAEGIPIKEMSKIISSIFRKISYDPTDSDGSRKCFHYNKPEKQIIPEGELDNLKAILKNFTLSDVEAVENEIGAENCISLNAFSQCCISANKLEKVNYATSLDMLQKALTATALKYAFNDIWIQYAKTAPFRLVADAFKAKYIENNDEKSSGYTWALGQWEILMQRNSDNVTTEGQLTAMLGEWDFISVLGGEGFCLEGEKFINCFWNNLDLTYEFRYIPLNFFKNAKNYPEVNPYSYYINHGSCDAFKTLAKGFGKVSEEGSGEEDWIDEWENPFDESDRVDGTTKDRIIAMLDTKKDTNYFAKAFDSNVLTKFANVGLMIEDGKTSFTERFSSNVIAEIKGNKLNITGANMLIKKLKKSQIADLPEYVINSDEFNINELSMDQIPKFNSDENKKLYIELIKRGNELVVADFDDSVKLEMAKLIFKKISCSGNTFVYEENGNYNLTEQMTRNLAALICRMSLDDLIAMEGELGPQKTDAFFKIYIEHAEGFKKIDGNTKLSDLEEKFTSTMLKYAFNKVWKGDLVAIVSMEFAKEVLNRGYIDKDKETAWKIGQWDKLFGGNASLISDGVQQFNGLFEEPFLGVLEFYELKNNQEYFWKTLTLDQWNKIPNKFLSARVNYPDNFKECTLFKNYSLNSNEAEKLSEIGKIGAMLSACERNYYDNTFSTNLLAEFANLQLECMSNGKGGKILFIDHFSDEALQKISGNDLNLKGANVLIKKLSSEQCKNLKDGVIKNSKFLMGQLTADQISDAMGEVFWMEFIGRGNPEVMQQLGKDIKKSLLISILGKTNFDNDKFTYAESSGDSQAISINIRALLSEGNEASHLGVGDLKEIEEKLVEEGSKIAFRRLCIESRNLNDIGSVTDLNKLRETITETAIAYAFKEIWKKQMSQASLAFIAAVFENDRSGDVAAKFIDDNDRNAWAAAQWNNYYSKWISASLDESTVNNLKILFRDMNINDLEDLESQLEDNSDGQKAFFKFYIGHVKEVQAINCGMKLSELSGIFTEKMLKYAFSEIWMANSTESASLELVKSAINSNYISDYNIDAWKIGQWDKLFGGNASPILDGGQQFNGLFEEPFLGVLEFYNLKNNQEYFWKILALDQWNKIPNKFLSAQGNYPESFECTIFESYELSGSDSEKSEKFEKFKAMLSACERNYYDNAFSINLLAEFANLQLEYMPNGKDEKISFIEHFSDEALQKISGNDLNLKGANVLIKKLSSEQCENLKDEVIKNSKFLMGQLTADQISDAMGEVFWMEFIGRGNSEVMQQLGKDIKKLLLISILGKTNFDNKEFTYAESSGDNQTISTNIRELLSEGNEASHLGVGDLKEIEEKLVEEGSKTAFRRLSIESRKLNDIGSVTDLNKLRETITETAIAYAFKEIWKRQMSQASLAFIAAVFENDRSSDVAAKFIDDNDRNAWAAAQWEIYFGNSGSIQHPEVTDDVLKILLGEREFCDILKNFTLQANREYFWRHINFNQWGNIPIAFFVKSGNYPNSIPEENKLKNSMNLNDDNKDKFAFMLSAKSDQDYFINIFPDDLITAFANNALEFRKDEISMPFTMCFSDDTLHAIPGESLTLAGANFLISKAKLAQFQFGALTSEVVRSSDFKINEVKISDLPPDGFVPIHRVFLERSKNTDSNSDSTDNNSDFTIEKNLICQMIVQCASVSKEYITYECITNSSDNSGQENIKNNLLNLLKSFDRRLLEEIEQQINECSRTDREMKLAIFHMLCIEAKGCDSLSADSDFSAIKNSITDEAYYYALNNTWKNQYKFIPLAEANEVLLGSRISGESNKHKLIKCQWNKIFGKDCNTIDMNNNNEVINCDASFKLLMSENFTSILSKYKLKANRKYFWSKLTNDQWQNLPVDFLGKSENYLEENKMPACDLKLEWNANNSSKFVAMLEANVSPNYFANIFPPETLANFANVNLKFHDNSKSFIECFDEIHLQKIPGGKLAADGVDVLIEKLSVEQVQNLPVETVDNLGNETVKKFKAAQIPAFSDSVQSGNGIGIRFLLHGSVDEIGHLQVSQFANFPKLNSSNFNVERFKEITTPKELFIGLFKNASNDLKKGITPEQLNILLEENETLENLGMGSDVFRALISSLDGTKAKLASRLCIKMAAGIMECEEDYGNFANIISFIAQSSDEEKLQKLLQFFPKFNESSGKVLNEFIDCTIRNGHSELMKDANIAFIGYFIIGFSNNNEDFKKDWLEQKIEKFNALADSDDSVNGVLEILNGGKSRFLTGVLLHCNNAAVTKAFLAKCESLSDFMENGKYATLFKGDRNINRKTITPENIKRYYVNDFGGSDSENESRKNIDFAKDADLQVIQLALKNGSETGPMSSLLVLGSGAVNSYIQNGGQLHLLCMEDIMNADSQILAGRLPSQSGKQDHVQLHQEVSSETQMDSAGSKGAGEVSLSTEHNNPFHFSLWETLDSDSIPNKTIIDLASSRHANAIARLPQRRIEKFTDPGEIENLLRAFIVKFDDEKLKCMNQNIAVVGDDVQNEILGKVSDGQLRMVATCDQCLNKHTLESLTKTRIRAISISEDAEDKGTGKLLIRTNVKYLTNNQFAFLEKQIDKRTENNFNSNEIKKFSKEKNRRLLYRLKHTLTRPLTVALAIGAVLLALAGSLVAVGIIAFPAIAAFGIVAYYSILFAPAILLLAANAIAMAVQLRTLHRDAGESGGKFEDFYLDRKEIAAN